MMTSVPSALAAPTRKLRPARPRKPAWLTDYGGRVWDTVVTELEPLGLLSPVDRDVLAAYCDMASFAKQARDQLRREGITRRGRDG
jgi:P27 family predicted phage terminase small subunit